MRFYHGRPIRATRLHRARYQTSAEPKQPSSSGQKQNQDPPELDRPHRNRPDRHRPDGHTNHDRSNSPTTGPLRPSLEENKNLLLTIFQDCDDLVIRPLANNSNALIAFFKCMIDQTTVDRDILQPLADFGGPLTVEAAYRRMHVANLFVVEDWHEIVLRLPYGFVLLFVDGEAKAILAEANGFETRNISAPEREIVVRGPDESFTENVEITLSQIRRRLPVPELKVKQFFIGRTSQTRVLLLYLDGIVNRQVRDEMLHRLQQVDIDLLNDGNKLQQFISDNPYSPFPQMLTTERPDRAVMELNEGKVVLAVNGTPNVLIAPYVLVDGFVTMEDYYHHFTFVTAVRLLRYLNVFVSLLGSSIYIALTTFHVEALPTSLLINLSSAREGVPFPAVIEALLMEIAIETLREAGIRLPRAVGQAISIVGALIIGQAAVDAGLVSQAMVVVVAITGVAGFTVPYYEMSITLRLLRFPIMFLSAALGMFGVLLGTLFILIHIAHIRSFGVPYLTPLAPTIWRQWNDLVWRAPIFKIPYRSPLVEDNRRRYGNAAPARIHPRRREK